MALSFYGRSGLLLGHAAVNFGLLDGVRGGGGHGLPLVRPGVQRPPRVVTSIASKEALARAEAFDARVEIDLPVEVAAASAVAALSIPSASISVFFEERVEGARLSVVAHAASPAATIEAPSGEVEIDLSSVEVRRGWDARSWRRERRKRRR